MVDSAAGTETSPTISVVLPVLNEARDLPRLLDELRRQSSPPGGFEVLVADGGSTDGTRELVTSLAQEWPSLRLLDNERRLSSAGRNVGARAARGRYVMFLDGHCALPRLDYLVRVVEIFEESGAACLSRPQPLNRLKDGGWAEAISDARHSWFGHASGSDIYGGEPGPTDPKSAGAVYLRSCFDEVGFYDERFDACEDVEFNHRVAAAGMLAWRHPDLAVHYRPRSTLKGLYRQMFRYGRGRARLMGRHPDVKPWPLVLITLFALACVVVLALDGPASAVVLLAVPVAAWSIVAAVESLRSAGPGPMAARTFFAFVTVYAGLVFGFWRGLPEMGRFRQPPPD